MANHTRSSSLIKLHPESHKTIQYHSTLNTQIQISPVHPQLHVHIYIFCSTVGREAVGAPALKRHCPHAPQFASAAVFCSVQNLQHQPCGLWGFVVAVGLAVLLLSTPRPPRTPLTPPPPCLPLMLLLAPAPLRPRRMPAAVPGCFLLPLPLPPPPPAPTAAGCAPPQATHVLFLAELTSVQAAQVQLCCSAAGMGSQPALPLDLLWLLVGGNPTPKLSPPAASPSVKSMTTCGAAAAPAPAAAAASCCLLLDSLTPPPGAPPAEGGTVHTVSGMTHLTTLRNILECN